MFIGWLLLSKENPSKVSSSLLLLLILIQPIITPSLRRQFTREPPKLIKVNRKLPHRRSSDRHALRP